MELTGKYDNRPQLKEMLSMVQAKQKPEWRTIIVFSLSRLHRNLKNSLQYMDIFSDNGFELLSITEQFDDTPTGRFSKKVTCLVNEFSSEQNSTNTHAAMLEKASHCSHCGGVPPLGYDVDPTTKSLIVNESEAEIVREIFDLYEQNFSYRKMADILNNKGYRTKKGKKFTKNSFDTLLHQEKYIGIFSWNKASVADSNGKHNSHKQKPIEEQVRVPDGCQAIISKEQFENVHNLFEMRRDGSASSKNRHHYLLSGLKIMKCAECGAYMIGAMRSSRGKKYKAYYCPNHKYNGCSTKEIKADNLNKMVIGLILNDTYNRNDFAQLSQELKSNSRTRVIKKKLEGNKKAATNIVHALTKSKDEILMEKLKALSEERKILEAQLLQAQTHITSIDSSNIKDVCRKLGSYLKSTESLDVKKYLPNVIPEISVGNDTVQIKLTDF
jgi:site-specific DNA recombinase